jgi:hypothetical protein
MRLFRTQRLQWTNVEEEISDKWKNERCCLALIDEDFSCFVFYRFYGQLKLKFVESVH